MSTLKVEVVEIEQIVKHPNADRLSLATVKGWQCVVANDQWQVGNIAVYFPIDSILPPKLEATLFPPDSKVRLSKSRIRTIKLRGAISQGLLVSIPELQQFGIIGDEEVGEDLTELLGVTKFEASDESIPASMNVKRSKKQSNPNFRKYTDIENFKNYPGVFHEGEEVVITEKIHGSNFRAGWVPFVADTLFKKLKQFIGLAPKYEFVFGSHNVQLQNKLTWNGYYDSNIYAEMVVKYDLKKKLQPGQVIYGEVYGDGIQKGYTYGCAKGEHKLIVFDLMVNGEYQSPIDLAAFTVVTGLPQAPVLHRGPYDTASLKALSQGDSILAPDQKVREGIVIKPIWDTTSYFGRRVLKMINDDYLLNKDNTDFH